jgi:hypothetical protein
MSWEPCYKSVSETSLCLPLPSVLVCGVLNVLSLSKTSFTFVSLLSTFCTVCCVSLLSTFCTVCCVSLLSTFCIVCCVSVLVLGFPDPSSTFRTVCCVSLLSTFCTVCCVSLLSTFCTVCCVSVLVFGFPYRSLQTLSSAHISLTNSNNYGKSRRANLSLHKPWAKFPLP